MQIDLNPDLKNLPEGTVLVKLRNAQGQERDVLARCQDTIEARNAVEAVLPGCTIISATMILAPFA